MPNVGFDPTSNVLRNNWEKRRAFRENVLSGRAGPGALPMEQRASARVTERRMGQLQQRRSGEWGRLPEDLSAPVKALQRRMAGREQVRSGQYFMNTVAKKQAETTQTGYTKSMERLNMLKKDM